MQKVNGSGPAGAAHQDDRGGLWGEFADEIEINQCGLVRPDGLVEIGAIAHAGRAAGATSVVPAAPSTLNEEQRSR